MNRSQGLEAEFNPDPVVGLYTSNSTAPLGIHAGLRQFYEFGLYSHCAYVNGTAGICSNITAANKFHPYDAIVGDMAANYSQATSAILLGTTFQNSGYLGTQSKAAYYLILLATICTALALVTLVPCIYRLYKTNHYCSGVLKHTVAFLLSSTLSVLGSFLLLVGAALWTVIIKKAASLNSHAVNLNGQSIPLGINTSVGPGLYLTWAAFACLTVSIVPYMLRCVE